MEHGWRLWILVRTSKRGVAWRIQVPLGLHGLWGGHVELVAHQVGLALHLGPLVAPMARWRWDGTSREVKELMVRVDVLEGADVSAAAQRGQAVHRQLLRLVELIPHAPGATPLVGHAWVEQLRVSGLVSTLVEQVDGGRVPVVSVGVLPLPLDPRLDVLALVRTLAAVRVRDVQGVEPFG